jgi:hypothetical protein
MPDDLTIKERLGQMIGELEPEVGTLVKFVIDIEQDTMNEKYSRVRDEIRKHIDKVVTATAKKQ